MEQMGASQGGVGWVELGEKRDRRGVFPRQVGHKSTIRLAASSSSNARTSVSTLAVGGKVGSEIIDDRREGGGSVATFEIFDRDGIGLDSRSSTSSSHWPRVSSSCAEQTPRGRRGCDTMSGSACSHHAA